MKKLALVLLSALLVLSLFACNAKEDTEDSLDDYAAPDYTYTMKDDKNTIIGTLTFEDGVAESAVITAYAGSATLHDVTIPAIINDREVSGIGANAFYQLSAVRNVVIPEKVEFIGEFAFAGCTSLETIVIPASVKYIDDFAFYGCTSLKSVVFAGNAVTEIGDFAFLDCTALKTVALPEGLESIGDQAFGRCEALASITAPSTLKSIGTLAFTGCKGLNVDSALKLSASIEKIGEYAFSGIDKDNISAPEGSYAAEYVAAMIDLAQEETAE